MPTPPFPARKWNPPTAKPETSTPLPVTVNPVPPAYFDPSRTTSGPNGLRSPAMVVCVRASTAIAKPLALMTAGRSLSGRMRQASFAASPPTSAPSTSMKLASSAASWKRMRPPRGEAPASRIAWRSEPTPLSAVVVTVNSATAPGGALIFVRKALLPPTLRSGYAVPPGPGLKSAVPPNRPAKKALPAASRPRPVAVALPVPVAVGWTETKLPAESYRARKSSPAASPARSCRPGPGSKSAAVVMEPATTSWPSGPVRTAVGSPPMSPAKVATPSASA